MAVALAVAKGAILAADFIRHLPRLKIDVGASAPGAQGRRRTSWSAPDSMSFFSVAYLAIGGPNPGGRTQRPARRMLGRFSRPHWKNAQARLPLQSARAAHGALRLGAGVAAVMHNRRFLDRSTKVETGRSCRHQMPVGRLAAISVRWRDWWSKWGAIRSGGGTLPAVPFFFACLRPAARRQLSARPARADSAESSLRGQSDLRGAKLVDCR